MCAVMHQGMPVSREQSIRAKIDQKSHRMYFVFVRNSELVDLNDDLRALKAIASPVCFRILELLKNPVENFPPQVVGLLLFVVGSADFIRDELGNAAATASRHLTLLTDCGLLIATRKKGWTFYRHNKQTLTTLTARLAAGL